MTQVSFKVRLATVDDAAALARLSYEFNGGEHRQAAAIAESLTRGGELVAVAVAVQEGRVIGFGCAQSYRSFCYSEAYGEITEMYIEQAYRRQGAATALLDLLEKELSRRSVVSIKILTGNTNDSALRTYGNNGYTRENEAVMIKELC